MSARTKARKRALDVLYECDMRSATVETVLARREAPLDEFAHILVSGVASNRSRLDELIETYSQGWDLDRMPVVDRNLLRIAIFEIIYLDDVPDAVAIDESLDLARSLSTDDSASFINGVLAQVVRAKPSLGR